MSRRSGLFLVALVPLALFAPQTCEGPPAPAFRPSATGAREAAVSPRPLHFEPNLGQAGDGVDWVGVGPGYLALLDRQGFWLRLPAAPPSGAEPDAWTRSTPAPDLLIRAELVGAGPHARWEAGPRLPGTSDAYVGRDARRWRRGIPHHAEVRLREVHPGVDVRFTGARGRLRYDVIVAPGADAAAVGLRFTGTGRPAVDGDGHLRLQVPGGEVLHLVPRAWESDGRGGRTFVPAGFRAEADGTVRFEVAREDPRRLLVIDPEVVYVAGVEPLVTSLTRTPDGDLLLAGTTLVPDATAGEHRDALVEIVDPDTQETLRRVTYGGTGGESLVKAAMRPGLEALYLTGLTDSDDLPVPSGAQTTLAGYNDVFVARFDPGGLVWGTYLGGDAAPSMQPGAPVGAEMPGGLAVGAGGDVFVAGTTLGVTATTGAVDEPGIRSAFVARFEPDGTLDWLAQQGGSFCTSPGGTALDGKVEATGVAVFGGGQVIVVGSTSAPDLPTSAGAFLPAHPLWDGDCPRGDALPAIPEVPWMGILGEGGVTWTHLTHLGGAGRALAVRHDTGEGTWVFGQGEGTAGWTFDAGLGAVAGSEAFLFAQHFGPDPAPDEAVSLGVDGLFTAAGFDLAPDGSLAFAGSSISPDLVLADPVQATAMGGSEAYVALTTPGRDALAFASYLGGSGSDQAGGVSAGSAGELFVAGRTDSTDFLDDGDVTGFAGFLVRIDTTDGGDGDGGVPDDGGVEDAGPGPDDGGAEDAGPGPDDGGVEDAGPGPDDGGAVDAGEDDAGEDDAGPTDAGADEDAGPTDGGDVSDAGADGAPTADDGDGCDCQSASPSATATWALALALAAVSARRRGGRRAAGRSRSS